MDGLTDAIVKLVGEYPAITVSILTLLLGGLLSVAGVIMKKLIKRVSHAFDALDRIEKVQGVQAENHIATIQKNTGETNHGIQELLKIQREMVGYLKAKAEDGKI